VEHVVGEFVKLAEPLYEERQRFLNALHTSEGDAVVRAHVGNLKLLFAATSAQAACRPGGKQYLESADFERIIGRVHEFGAHDFALSFSAGMCLHVDEVKSTRWQQMSFVEFLHSASYAAWITAGKASVPFVPHLGRFLGSLTAGRPTAMLETWKKEG